MGLSSQAVARAMALYQQRLELVAAAIETATSPAEFCAGERELHVLATELADELCAQLLTGMCAEKARRKAAAAEVRELAASKGLVLHSSGVRRTKVRLLGGTIAAFDTPHYLARAKVRTPKQTRGKDGRGVYPVLDQLGICNGATPALHLKVGYAVCEASSVNSARQMLEESGTVIDHKAALRLTYATSDTTLKARQRAIFSGNAPSTREFAGLRVVAAIDGGRINTRRRGPGGVPKGGRRKFTTEWREPKVISIYVLGDDGRRDRRFRPVIDGTLKDADAAFRLLLYHLRRVGADQAAELTLIGDGAKWIWHRADLLRERLGLEREQFHEIVDYFHAVERLTTFAKSWSDYGSARSTRWLARQKQRLKAGDMKALLSGFRLLREPHRQDLEKELPYWERNAHRMRFRAFREAGLPNGSGAVESAIRRVVNLRLKGSSVFWTEEHAEGILHLRSHAKSGRWDELEATFLTHCRWRPNANWAR